METGPALPCFPKDFSVFFPFLLFLKRGSPGTGRAWFDPRAAAQPGTAALHRGQWLGGEQERGCQPSWGRNPSGKTGRGWDEEGTLGRGMEPQLCQSGTPTRSGAGEGAHPNSLMASRASQGAGMSQPSSCLFQAPAPLPSEAREQRSPPGCKDCADGMAARRQGQAGAAVQALEKGYF